jgi:hypothetical protein
VEHDRTLGEKILREAREQFLREALCARLDHQSRSIRFFQCWAERLSCHGLYPWQRPSFSYA